MKIELQCFLGLYTLSYSYSFDLFSFGSRDC